MVKSYLLIPDESPGSGMYVPRWRVRPQFVEQRGRPTNVCERRHLVPRLSEIHRFPKAVSTPGAEVEYRVFVWINGETLTGSMRTIVAFEKSW